jgi:hypothetical protein
MSHFAKIENGIVQQVIVAEQDFIDSLEGQWVQTSYNTRGGIHYAPDSWEPDDGVAIRGNYAGIGYIYDETNDVFYEPKPHNGWILNQSTWLWEPPISAPQDGNEYRWNEELLEWVQI